MTGESPDYRRIVGRLRNEARHRPASSYAVTASDLKALLDATEYAEKRRWDAAYGVVEEAPIEKVRANLMVKLAAMAARREIPNIKALNNAERETARQMLADALARTLCDQYVFAERIRPGFMARPQY